jgi:hypothetical protein
LDPHTANIAAIAVNVYADKSAPTLVPILIEKEQDFEIGARVVIQEWDRIMKPLTDGNKRKERYIRGNNAPARASRRETPARS